MLTSRPFCIFTILWFFLLGSLLHQVRVLRFLLRRFLVLLLRLLRTLIPVDIFSPPRPSCANRRRHILVPMSVILRSCTLHHVGRSLILHKYFTVLVEYLKKSMNMLSIAVNNLFTRYIKIVHLNLTREQIDQLLQLLPWIR